MKSVDVLLATYYPDWTFFKQQLISLNEQTYDNMRIIICDDSADNTIFLQIESFVKQYVTNKPFILWHNETNLGSNRTFEKLTTVAQADLLAYCDQDDIWHANKVEQLALRFVNPDVTLVYSDLAVINAQNHIIANKFSQYNPRIQLMEGQHLFEFFIRRNCVTGCAMMIQSHIAKKALPFNEDYIHDHWLSLVASLSGEIVCIKQPLIDYRIHDNNQIGKSLLKSVNTLKTYTNDKLLIEKNKRAKLKECALLNESQRRLVEQEEQFIQHRINWWENPSFKHAKALLPYIKKDKQLILFELSMKILPKSIAQYIFKRLRK